MSEPLPRKLHSWIAGYEEYTSLTPAPDIYRKWAAVSCVAGALERRVWVKTNSGTLYPNLFLLFVGPPGTGKDPAINPIRELWTRVKNLKMAPNSMSFKGLMDALAAEGAMRQFHNPDTNLHEIFHSQLLAVGELGGFVSAHDIGHIALLCDLYQCGKVFEEKIRGREGVLRIERPHLHITAGVQPKYLFDLLPDSAWGQGLTARIIMVYHGTSTRKDLFNTPEDQTSLRNLLAHDLNQIANMTGEFTFTPEARNIVRLWHAQGCDQDKPTHSRLSQYVPKRIMHLLKLCMVMSAFHSNELTITAEDVRAALDILLEAEALMPEVFREMSSGGNLHALEETFNYALAEWNRGGQKPVPETKIVQFMQARVPVNHIQFTLDSMIRSGMLNVVGTDQAGRRHFQPKALEVTDEGSLPAVHEISRITRKK